MLLTGALVAGLVIVALYAFDRYVGHAPQHAIAMIRTVYRCLLYAWAVAWPLCPWRLERFLPRLERIQNIYTDPDVRVIVSVTTSPERLKDSLAQALHSVASVAHEIHLSLPKLYKNKDSYDSADIEALQLQFGSQLKVFHGGVDLGPVMKILPTLRRVLLEAAATVRVEDFKTYVVSIDDDTVYAPRDIVDIINDPQSANRVTAGYGRSQGGIMTPYGLHSIVYGPGVIRADVVETIAQYASLKECKFHDDLAIGNALARHGVPIKISQVDYRFLTATVSENALFLSQPSGLLVSPCNAAVAAAVGLKA